MVEFGGLLSSGGGTLICPTCENSWRQHLGDLATIAHEYLRKSPLMGTEFQPTGMLFGGAYASDGKRLLDFLGVGELPELGSGPSIEFAGQKFSMELEFEFRKLKVRRRFWLFGRKEFYE
jgi:hypothetical protein